MFEKKIVDEWDCDVYLPICKIVMVLHQIVFVPGCICTRLYLYIYKLTCLYSITTTVCYTINIIKQGCQNCRPVNVAM